MLSSWADRDSFGKELNKVLSPARPIQSVEHLRGRKKELLRIEKALFAHGRHIFIYGDISLESLRLPLQRQLKFNHQIRRTLTYRAPLTQHFEVL